MVDRRMGQLPVLEVVTSRALRYSIRYLLLVSYTELCGAHPVAGGAPVYVRLTER